MNGIWMVELNINNSTINGISHCIM
jgi:hypothetical protein